MARTATDHVAMTFSTQRIFECDFPKQQIQKARAYLESLFDFVLRVRVFHFPGHHREELGEVDLREQVRQVDQAWCTETCNKKLFKRTVPFPSASTSLIMSWSSCSYKRHGKRLDSSHFHSSLKRVSRQRRWGDIPLGFVQAIASPTNKHDN